MKCILCHGEDIEVTEVREELRIASDIVYVPIRIPVCRTLEKGIMIVRRSAFWRR